MGVLLFGASLWAEDRVLQQSILDLEARIQTYKPDPGDRDDAFCLVVKEAIISLKAGSGGIGCLVDGKTGEVVERECNRQYSPHFRSDMHGEMDLLNRYEDRVQKKGGSNSDNDPRQCGDLILFSSTEPCPMCLTRIINPDLEGGMAHCMEHLPLF